MKKIILASALCSTLAFGDFVGGEISIGYLNNQPSGTFAYKGDTSDVEETFGWKRENSYLIKAYIEHPLPVLPNLRASYTNLSHSGSSSVTIPVVYDNKPYTGKITTDFNADIIDATLYYEILDNWLNLDLGINAKYIDATASVQNISTGKSSADISFVLPTVYAKARLDIPMSNFSFQAEGDMIAYNKNTLYDLTLSARYTFIFGLGVEAGVKMLKFKLDDIDDVTADVDFTGIYAAAVWDF